MINIVDPLHPDFIHDAVNIWQFVKERNPELIKSMENVKNGIARRIYARKCIIKQITGDLAKSFFEICHTKGHLKTSEYIGLFYNDELVQVISFGKSRFHSHYEFEIIRMATCLNTVVVGGASKILNYFFQNFSNSVHTYAEKMLGDGNVYKELGFHFLNNTKPGYFWYRNGEIVSRHDSQKHKLHLLFEDLSDDELMGTETSIMTKRGFVKVFDMGNTSWGLNPTQQSIHKFNYVYKISRPSIDDKFYIGVHSTNALDDGYMGSGILISKSLKKYGAKNHVKEILKFAPTRAEALKIESELVDDDMLMDPNCLNLTNGGCSSSPFNSKNFVSMINEKFKNKHIMVHEDDVSHFMELGWQRGSNKPKTMGVFYKLENDDKVYRGMELPPGATRYFAKTTKNYKWIIRNGSRHLVPEDKILNTDQLCPELCSTNFGKRRLFKNGIFKFFTSEQIDSAILDGWSFEHDQGGPSSDRVEIIKDGVKIRVVEDTAFNMIKNDGWSLARKQLKSAPEQVIRVAKRLGMRIPITKLGSDGYVNPPKPKNKNGSSTGKFCIKKDGTKKMVSREEAIQMVKNGGWQLGAASCWRLASDPAKQLGRELGYDVE